MQVHSPTSLHLTSLLVNALTQDWMSDNIQTTNFKNLESCLSLEQTDWCGQKLNKFFTVKQSVPLKAARIYRAVFVGGDGEEMVSCRWLVGTSGELVVRSRWMTPGAT